MMVIKMCILMGKGVFFKFYGIKYFIIVKMRMSDFWKKEFIEIGDYYYIFRFYVICKSLRWELNDIFLL